MGKGNERGKGEGEVHTVRSRSAADMEVRPASWRASSAAAMAYWANSAIRCCSCRS